MSDISEHMFNMTSIDKGNLSFPGKLLRNWNKQLNQVHPNVESTLASRSSLQFSFILIRGHCGDEYFMCFPQHQSPPRGRKAITSQSYGFFPFAVFFSYFAFFATAEFFSQARGEKLKSNFLTPQQTEFVLGDGLRGQEKLLASL